MKLRHVNHGLQTTRPERTASFASAVLAGARMGMATLCAFGLLTTGLAGAEKGTENRAEKAAQATEQRNGQAAKGMDKRAEPANEALQKRAERGNKGKGEYLLPKAKAAKQVGEQADGYLGLVDENAPDQIKKMVEDTNERRKARYTDIAKKRGSSVESVAALAGERLAKRAKTGEMLRNAEGEWVKK